MADLNALVRNPIVLGGAAVLIVAAGVGGYFLGAGKSGSASGGGETTAVGGVCAAALDRATLIGILDASVKLASTEASDTDTKGRVVCTAKSGDITYTLTVDVLCGDMSAGKCVNLYKVSDSAGTTLYQRTKFLDPT